MNVGPEPFVQRVVALFCALARRCRALLVASSQRRRQDDSIRFFRAAGILIAVEGRHLPPVKHHLLDVEPVSIDVRIVALCIHGGSHVGWVPRPMRHRSVAQCSPCSILRRTAGRPCLPAQPLKSRVSSHVAWQDVDREARVGQNREAAAPVSRGWHGSRHPAAQPRGVVIISQAVQPLMSVRRGRARRDARSVRQGQLAKLLDNSAPHRGG